MVTTFVTIHYGFLCFRQSRLRTGQPPERSQEEDRADGSEEPPLIVTRPLRFFVQGEPLPLPASVNAHVPLPCRAPILVEANRNNHTGPVVIDPGCLQVMEDEYEHEEWNRRQSSAMHLLVARPIHIIPVNQ